MSSSRDVVVFLHLLNSRNFHILLNSFLPIHPDSSCKCPSMRCQHKHQDTPRSCCHRQIQCHAKTWLHGGEVHRSARSSPSYFWIGTCLYAPVQAQVPVPLNQCGFPKGFAMSPLDRAVIKLRSQVSQRQPQRLEHPSSEDMSFICQKICQVTH